MSYPHETTTTSEPITSVRVAYNGFANEDFDSEVEKLCKRFGLKFIGGGYSMVNGQRDMHFGK